MRNKQIADSFEVSKPFQPAEFGLSNEHYQTIVGSEVVRARLFGFPRGYKSLRKRFATADGDFFYADFTQENEDGA